MHSSTDANACSVRADEALLALAPKFESRWAAERLAERGSDEELDVACRQTDEIARQITEADATTLAGLQLKVRAIAWLFSADTPEFAGEHQIPAAQRWADKFFRELLSMQAVASATPPPATEEEIAATEFSPIDSPLRIPTWELLARVNDHLPSVTLAAATCARTKPEMIESVRALSAAATDDVDPVITYVEHLTASGCLFRAMADLCEAAESRTMIALANVVLDGDPVGAAA